MLTGRDGGNVAGSSILMGAPNTTPTAFTVI